MDLTDELARLEQRMRELQAEAVRLTAELERIGQHVIPKPDVPPLLQAELVDNSASSPSDSA